MHPATTRLLAGGVLLAGALLAGCGVPPELREQPQQVVSQSRTPSVGSTTVPTRLPPPAVPTPTSSAPAFDETIARDCAGRPGGAQVIAALRRADLLPDGTTVTVQKPPLCAGTWQYTVVQVRGHEPLQVVTKGGPTSLTVVTAGTDVCSIPVRTRAPAGIRSIACL